MDFNQLIYSRLAANASLVAKLATFDKQPAIFCQEFPADQQPGWSGKVEYPRIDYEKTVSLAMNDVAVGFAYVVRIGITETTEG